MSRLQKKCFIGATSVHLLLLATLVIGPGFFSKETVDESEVLTIIPLMATESGPAGGGAPSAPVQPTPPTPAPPTPAIQETPRTPEVRRVDPPPSRPPEPIAKPEPEKPSKPDRESLDPKPEKPVKPKTHEVSVNKNVVTISKDRRQPSTAPSTADADAKEERERAAAAAKLLANAGNRIKSGLSQSTQVNMPEGTGGGGFSYASYALIVKTVYTQAWSIPNDVTDDEAVVKVSIVVARDGNILSSRIITESGSKLVDRSIQNALDRVTTIGVAFPAGAKESQRTFNISFSLKAKKLLG